MAVGFTVTLEGADALSKRLEGLSYDMSKKGGRFALRKAAQVIRDQAKANARRIDDPQSAADIEKNITEKWSSRYNKTTGNLMFRIGVLGGAGGNLSKKDQASGLPGGDTRHWRFIEFGSENNRANPFMQNAMQQAAQKAVDTFVSQYGAALDRALKKLPK